MRLTSATTSFSLLALAAALGFATPAQAVCTPSVNSDVTNSTCIGTNALRINVTSGNDVGSSNTAMGHSALRNNTVGDRNTASGRSALHSNTGSNNIGLGFEAGSNLTFGSNNIAIGNRGVAGESSTIRIGTQGQQTRAFMAGIRDVWLRGGQTVVVTANGQLGTGPGVPVVPGTGTGNVALGGGALVSNTNGQHNTASGSLALYSNTSGNENTASGGSALYSNTTGDANTANGYAALQSNTEGYSNTASGVNALLHNTEGYSNTASGVDALLLNTTGAFNIALGFEAGSNLTTGSNNIAIGHKGVAAESATIRIGTQGTQTRAFMAGIRDVNVTGGQTVLVNAEGQLGVASSSRRYKQDIQPMGDASDALLRLQPVTFHYRQADENGERPLQYGLIAEDVAEVMPALTIYNDQGAPESVAYQLLPSLLLNEYQKQNRKLEATEAELAETKARFEAMEAEMAALKLAVSRLAAVPSATQLASGN